MPQWTMVYGWNDQPLTLKHVAPLRATLDGDRAEAALTEWLAQFEAGTVERGADTQPVFFEGGMWAIREAPTVVTLYSSGEDCFDSLSHYADWLYNLARHYGGDVTFEQRPYERRPRWLHAQ